MPLEKRITVSQTRTSWKNLLLHQGQGRARSHCFPSTLNILRRFSLMPGKVGLLDLHAYCSPTSRPHILIEPSTPAWCDHYSALMFVFAALTLTSVIHYSCYFFDDGQVSSEWVRVILSVIMAEQLVKDANIFSPGLLYIQIYWNTSNVTKH